MLDKTLLGVLTEEANSCNRHGKCKTNRGEEVNGTLVSDGEEEKGSKDPEGGCTACMEKGRSIYRQIKCLNKENKRLQNEIANWLVGLPPLVAESKTGEGSEEVSSETGSPNTLPASLFARAIDELLGDFDGSEELFRTWKRQVKLLGTICDLNSRAVRIYVYSKLKGRAAKWLYSKSKHLLMGIDLLLKEMKRVFEKPIDRTSLKAKIWTSDENLLNFIYENLENDDSFVGIKKRDDLLLVFDKSNKNGFYCVKQRTYNNNNNKIKTKKEKKKKKKKKTKEEEEEEEEVIEENYDGGSNDYDDDDDDDDDDDNNHKDKDDNNNNNSKNNNNNMDNNDEARRNKKKKLYPKILLLPFLFILLSIFLYLYIVI